MLSVIWAQSILVQINGETVTFWMAVRSDYNAISLTLFFQCWLKARFGMALLMTLLLRAEQCLHWRDHTGYWWKQTGTHRALGETCMFQSTLPSSAVRYCLVFIFCSDFNMCNSVGSERGHWAGCLGRGSVILVCIYSSLGTMWAQPEFQKLNTHSYFKISCHSSHEHISTGSCCFSSHVYQSQALLLAFSVVGLLEDFLKGKKIPIDRTQVLGCHCVL